MNARASAWISHGFETLISSVSLMDQSEFHYDIVIIGSGYGGAIAASQLAGTLKNGRPLKICVLERGREYLPGMFPSRLADLPEHTRLSTPNSAAPKGNRDGLFDIRVNPHLNTVIANGLGGGSLINAGVMIEPTRAIFDQRWPTPLQDSASQELFETYYEQAKQLLGASDKHGPNTIARHATHQHKPLSKHQRLQVLASDASRPDHPNSFSDASITMAMEDKTNSAGVHLNACNLCGDCATGCNHNAKDSLDTNLLVQAWQQGVELYTGAAALKLSPCKNAHSDSGWQLSVVHTKSKLRKRQTTPLKLTAAKVIVAAGSLGSTEILLRSRSSALPLSPRLGQQFSSNGDMLATVFNQHDDVNAVADENSQPDKRRIGPTITGIIDLRDNDNPILIQEMAVPGALRRVYEEMVTTTNSLAELMEVDRQAHGQGQPQIDPYSVSADKINRTAIYAIMGDDGSQGSLELVNGDTQNELEGDGCLKVQWSGLSDHPLFPDQISALENLVERSGAGGKAQPNPAWRSLPESMADLLGGSNGPLLTVHPLGGCAMGNNFNDGVVDQFGRVFDLRDTRSTSHVHDNLVVLDGAIIPGALGANPALTIAAVSLRAIVNLRVQWQLDIADDQVPANNDSPSLDASPSALQRPVFADKSTLQPTVPTRIEITERIGGRVMLSDQKGKPIDCMVDITLRFKPKPILDFIHCNDRTMIVNSERTIDEPVSQLRIFERQQWLTLIRQGASDDDFDQQALLVTPVHGSMEILAREASTYRTRLWRAVPAWLINRGLRDSFQGFTRLLVKAWLWPYTTKSTRRETPAKSTLLRKIKNVAALASRAGEVRLFDYRLTIDRPAGGWPVKLGGFDPQETSLPVSGRKRISYTLAANPMRQLEDMFVEVFPGLQPDHQQPKGKPAYLRFDSRFLTHYKKPLLRIIDQQDQVTALADVGAFFAYFLRLLVNVHLWSFRKPDTPLARVPNRLPGAICGVAPPEITELCIDQHDVGLAVDLPVKVRLTRYPQPNSTKPPVVMIHGYSASGTTYTHPSIDPNMARYFWKQGRDVWVLDLRTSSGMPTAMLPWSFEDVAFADIPLAIDHICHKTQHKQVDVIAHCMGSAMFSMAVLAPPKPGDHYFRERQQLPGRIHKAVLSQVGPRVVFSPENIFRAYGLSYIQQLMPFVFYSFKASDTPSAAEQLLDRLLSALPYPDGEFELENPWAPWAKTPYVSTRHRMDGLYGRTFSLANMAPQTLDSIDDFFGPLSMVTLGQVIRFALHERVTNKHGENEFVTNERLKSFWTFPTLSVHGDENGLADISTLGRMEETMQTAGRDYQTQVLSGFGHQDSLIGVGVKKNFDKISAFLNQRAHAPKPSNQNHRYVLSLPFSGPVIGSIKTGAVPKLPVSLGFSKQRNKPEFVLFVAVKHEHQTLRLATDGTASSSAQLRDNLCVKFAAPRVDNWLKTELPITPVFEQADGILTLVLDDVDLRLDDLVHRALLPDNLLDVIDLPSIASDDQHQTLSDYLQQHILSPAFMQTLMLTLQRPREQLEPATIQLPSHEAQLHATQFVLAACQYTPGILDKRVAYRSYGRLANWLDQGLASSAADLTPQFAVLMGDQVYTDASAGLFDPTERFERYTSTYHTWLNQRSVKTVLRRLPAYMMLDDHELLNDWDRAENHLGEAGFYRNGKRSYFNFQRNLHNTPIHNDLSDAPVWYRFTQQGFDFFMADSRSERDGRSASHTDASQHIATTEDATIISDEQWQALKSWLLERPIDGRPRFIVSASMLLPRRIKSTGNDQPAACIHSDAWDGYPKSQHELLRFIATHDIKNLVFLSGDEHLSSVVDITLRHQQNNTLTRLHSIHSSALYAPLSFVNSTPELFKGQENFAVHGAGDIQCDVSSRFHHGDGFALISAYLTDQTWTVECHFNREQDAGLTEVLTMADTQSMKES